MQDANRAISCNALLQQMINKGGQSSKDFTVSYMLPNSVFQFHPLMVVNYILEWLF